MEFVNTFEFVKHRDTMSAFVQASKFCLPCGPCILITAFIQGKKPCDMWSFTEDIKDIACQFSHLQTRADAKYKHWIVYEFIL